MVKKINFQTIYYDDFLLIRGGFLPNANEAHALMYYAFQAVKIRASRGNIPVLEGDPDPTENPKQVFTSVATWYGVDPHKMSNYWQPVNAQLQVLGIEPIVEEEYKL